MKGGVKKSKTKAFMYRLHLWLGLSVGVIIFIVSITGSMLTFKDEIKAAFEPWRFVEPIDASFAPPSQLIDTAQRYVPGAIPTALTYEGKKNAAAVGFWIPKEDRMDFKIVFMNPYTAECIKVDEPLAKNRFNFFEFIEKGHTRIWLPDTIGKPLVGISVILFVVLLITGLIMWWPKTWTVKALKRSLSVKFSANLKRLNYDLHNSLGIYALLIALILALTGLTWSFQGFDKALYYLFSLGKEKQEHRHPHSDISNKSACVNDSIPGIDRAFFQALALQPNPERVFITPALKDEDDAYELIFYKYSGKYYHQNRYYFDRYTLKPLRIEGDRYENAILAEKISRMYYDIHTGSILGMTGKIIVFIVGLLCASLPVTGFIIWLNKRKKKPLGVRKDSLPV